MNRDTVFAFIGNLRPSEVIVILLVVLLLFGAERLPKLARSMGKSIREFKKAASEISEEFQTSLDTEELAKADLSKRPVQVPEKASEETLS